MKKLLFTVLAMSLSFSAMAATSMCSVEFSKKSAVINWTAFKTPKKVGVKGHFTDFKINTQKSADLEQLLSSATFEINTKSTDTGDKARDVKIFNFFFKTMVKGSKITGKVLKVNADKIDVELTFNGVTKKILMTSTVTDEGKNLILSGAIDVLDFGMKENLGALTKACFEKHEGVTWPNVDIELVTPITSTCKK